MDIDKEKLEKFISLAEEIKSEIRGEDTQEKLTLEKAKEIYPDIWDNYSELFERFDEEEIDEFCLEKARERYQSESSSEKAVRSARAGNPKSLAEIAKNAERGVSKEKVVDLMGEEAWEARHQSDDSVADKRQFNPSKTEQIKQIKKKRMKKRVPDLVEGILTEKRKDMAEKQLKSAIDKIFDSVDKQLEENYV